MPDIMIGRLGKRGRGKSKTRRGLEGNRKRKLEAIMLGDKVLKAKYHKVKEDTIYVHI